MKKILLGLLLIKSLMPLELNQIPSALSLDPKNGGMLDGSTWKSSILKGKISTLFYIDPDEKGLNGSLADTLQTQNFDTAKYQHIAIINLSATWKPNALIEMKLKEKQKEYPNSTYVKDKNKILVKEWGLSDDNYNVLVFNKQSKLIYQKFGKLSEKDKTYVLKLIKDNL